MPRRQRLWLSSSVDPQSSIKDVYSKIRRNGFSTDPFVGNFFAINSVYCMYLRMLRDAGTPRKDLLLLRYVGCAKSDRNHLLAVKGIDVFPSRDSDSMVFLDGYKAVS